MNLTRFHMLKNAMCAFLFLAFSPFGAVLAVSVHNGDDEHFSIYYSDQAPIESFNRYQLLIFDRQHHPRLQPLHEEGKMLLGRIDLGEIDGNSPYFPFLKNKGLVLKENPERRGSYFIDLRTPVWPQIVIEEIVPQAIAEGFDGVFLDNLDNYAGLERSDPARYQGMRLAAAHLVMALRMHYPSMKIMVNHAYSILTDIAPHINMAMGEALLGDFNFSRQTYMRNSMSGYNQKASQLLAAKKINPSLKVYTLDYADTASSSAVEDIDRIQRKNGFIPYVASVGLDKVTEVPREKKGIFQ